MMPRSLTHRAPLLGLVVAWAAGSILAHSGLISVVPAVCASLALLGLASAWLPALRTSLRSRPAIPTLQALGLCVSLAACGALRTYEERARPPEWDALGLPPREALLVLRIERPFSSREPDRASGLARVVSADPHLADLAGQRINFSVTWPTSATAAPLRGAEFTALGLLAPLPFSPPPADFNRFLADEGVNFSFSRARLQDEPRSAGAWSRLCAAAGMRLERILRTGLADNPRQADLYVAMLLGQKQALSVEQKDWFVRSGTMHLFAVSGLHIAAIAVALNTLLGLLRLPGRVVFFAGTALLWLYVAITGGDASAVRAFWMITCLLAARQLRAPANSLSALAASALGVLVLAPHQLFTAGFQMSYGIVAALLLYGVPLQEKWHTAWQPWANLPPAARSWRQRGLESAGRFALAALALGLAATLVSTPATLGFFGLLAPGGFFVNLVLIPLSSLVLFAGVGSLLAGLVGIAPLASLFNHAGALVLAGMEHAVASSLRVPGSSWPARFDPPWLAPVSLTAMAILLAAGYARRWPRWAGGYWAPYVALGLLLFFGASAP
jgi:competence protein ComEC